MVAKRVATELVLRGFRNLKGLGRSDEMQSHFPFILSVAMALVGCDAATHPIASDSTPAVPAPVLTVVAEQLVLP